MRFKVIICSHCQKARGVRTDSKQVSCLKCGARIDVEQAKAYFLTDSQQNLTKAVGDVNAKHQLKGRRDEDYEKLMANMEEPTKGRTVRRRIEEALLGMVDEKGHFSLQDVFVVVSTEMDLPEPDVEEEAHRTIRSLKDKGWIIESRAGTYRRV